MSAPFPGGVGLSGLEVYPWEAADGVCGGSPHLHTACTEAYVVTGGTGALVTLTDTGAAEQPLAAGDVVWFTPGTIHRAVNTADLRVVVVMQNSGLPEAGDAVMTFPPEHLATPEAYAAAASLDDDGVHGSLPTREERARARRDLAVAGFGPLVTAAQDGDLGPLHAFRAAAVALMRTRVPDFEARWRAGALASAMETGVQLRALAAGDGSHLRRAAVHSAAPPEGFERGFGMCGRLVPYDRLSGAG